MQLPALCIILYKLKLFKIPSYTEADLQAAMNDVLDGKNLRTSSVHHKVLRQTLADRILGHTTVVQSKISKQKLSPLFEEKLVRWILI